LRDHHRKDCDMRAIAPAPPRGTSLIETLVVVSVIAIGLAIGTPSLIEFRLRQQMAAARNVFTVALASARMAAVTRQRRLVMCPTSGANQCAGGTLWNKGWLLFVDDNRNARRDAREVIVDSGEEIAGVALATTSGRDHITWFGDGTTPGTNATFTFCDRRGVRAASALVMNNFGRVRLARVDPANAAAACSAL
jgi:type IV fimbrial biogenesis protein FimT